MTKVINNIPNPGSTRTPLSASLTRHIKGEVLHEERHFFFGTRQLLDFSFGTRLLLDFFFGTRQLLDFFFGTRQLLDFSFGTRQLVVTIIIPSGLVIFIRYSL